MEVRLSPGLVESINLEVNKTQPKKSLPSAAATIAWLTNIGGLISEYLPQFLAVLKALSAVTATQPTIAEFFAQGNAMFNPAGKPAPAPIVK